jgi:glycosyltransferase involved in cell wall biosynthesis
MRILIEGESRANYLAKCHEALRTGLRATFDARPFGKGYPGYDPAARTFSDVVRLTFPDGPPDLLIMEHREPKEQPRFSYEGAADAPVPKAIILRDFWNITEHWRDEFIEFVERNDISIIFSYFYRPIEIYSQTPLRDRFVYLPPCFDPAIFNDWRMPKDYHVGFLAAGTADVDPFYPERRAIHEQLLKRDDLRYLWAAHPGWKDHAEAHPLVGAGFSKAINSCRLFVTTASRYGNAQPKYFEAMASRTVLLADEPLQAERLHLRDGVNYVRISPEDVMEKVDYYLAHPELCERIAEEAYRTAMRYHTGYARAMDLYEGAQRVLSRNRTGETANQRPQAIEVREKAKPRVLVIVDAPNWAHDIKTRNLMKHLAGDYEFVKRYQSQVSEADLDSADLIMIYYWLQLGSMLHLKSALERNRHKLLMGICSHVELEGENRERGLAELHRLAKAVFVNSKFLEEEFTPLLNKPVYYTPNGVDTEFYTPVEKKNDSRLLRVGWAGSLGNMGPKVRGYYDYIVPACERVEGVKLVAAIREEKWRGLKEMREFYHSLDVYLCASESESGPNPCLEAAACGVPLLTTCVGNMPELITDGENGLFIERDIADIAAKLTTLRDDPDLRRRMGHAILSSIQDWDWKHQAENYRRMFEDVLGAAVQSTGEVAEEIPVEVAEAIQAGTKAAQREDWDAALLAFAGALAAAPELPGLADAVKNVQQVRARLAAEQAAAQRPDRTSSRRDGMSFCIVTGGKRPEKLRLVIESIRRQNVPDYEIIVSGNHREEEGILYIPAVEAAGAGRLGEMRNLAVKRAQFNRIVMLDDDILLGDGWYEAMTAHGEDFDILTSRIVLPDGTRYWDYVTKDGPRGHRILRHDEPSDDFVYMSGGTAWVMKDYVADAVHWEEHLGFNQEEDVRFARRCIEAGFRIAHNTDAVAYHYDGSYTRVGRVTQRRPDGLDNLWLIGQPELMDAEALFGLVQEKAAASEVAELADCLRAGMQLYPEDNRFPTVWSALENQIGGDAGNDRWSLNGDSSLKALLAQIQAVVALAR